MGSIMDGSASVKKKQSSSMSRRRSMSLERQMSIASHPMERIFHMIGRGKMGNKITDFRSQIAD
jgi:hypothetical protein